MGKRRLMLLFSCVLAINMVFSQSSNTSKQINDIKRDGQYFYAESTLETEAAAHESATLMLANFINDYINNNNLPSNKKVTEKDLASAKSLSMNRGPMVRVFLYVKKSDYVSEESASNAAAKKEERTAEVSSIEKEVTESVSKQVVEKQESQQQVIEKQAPVIEKQAPVTEKQAAVVETPKQQPEEKTVNPPLADTVVADNSLRLPIEWQQVAINNMLKESSLKGVMTLLSRMKAEYKVKRFGTYNECGNAALSFWIICENDSNMSLITILGPGTDSRVNFKTLQYDSLGNYSGKNAIWFELAK